MTRSDQAFIAAIQRRTARVAVGPSTVRGQGPAGLVDAARVHLTNLPLRQFGVSRPSLFQQRLDAATKELQAAMPKGGRSWGMARKVLNIFLRDVLYNSYLREPYHLDRAEALMELPLDSITAKRLRHVVGADLLPGWAGVKHLSQTVSGQYQTAAAAVAQQLNVARVHLDAIWWADR